MLTSGWKGAHRTSGYTTVFELVSKPDISSKETQRGCDSQLTPTKAPWVEAARCARSHRREPHPATAAKIREQAVAIKCGMVGLPRTCIAEPVPSLRLLSSKTRVEFAPFSRKSASPQPGHRQPGIF